VTDIPLFEALAAGDRELLLTELRRRRFKKGEVLFHEGDPGDTLHLIDRGHIAIRTSTPLGDVLTLSVLGPGDVFGEQALVTADSRRTASAVALEPAETRSLTADRFDRLRNEEPAINRFLVEVLAAQVRRLSDQVREALYVPAEIRTLRRLNGLASSFSRPDQTCVIPVTQDDLASLAGVSRPTANRVLKRIEADGVIALHRGRLEVLDRDELSRRCR